MGRIARIYEEAAEGVRGAAGMGWDRQMGGRETTGNDQFYLPDWGNREEVPTADGRAHHGMGQGSDRYVSFAPSSRSLA